MNSFRDTFSLEFPLFCGIMSQWPSKILVSLIPKLHIFPNLGLMKRVCQLSSLINSSSSNNNNSNQSITLTTNTKRIGIEVNEVSLVMTRLGLNCKDEEDPLDDQGEIYKMMSMDEIEGLFKEEEPSFDEIKQAFDVFDWNGDGFIDALELSQVLLSLGVLEDDFKSQNVRMCERVLCGFDQKGVGLVDIHDFVRLMEKVF